MKALAAVGRFIRSITTARDNETPSLLRIVALFISAEFIVWGAIAIYRGEPFTPQEYALGAGALVMAIGSALRISLPANAGNDGWQNNIPGGSARVDDPDAGR